MLVMIAGYRIAAIFLRLGGMNVLQHQFDHINFPPIAVNLIAQVGAEFLPNVGPPPHKVKTIGTGAIGFYRELCVVPHFFLAQWVRSENSGPTVVFRCPLHSFKCMLGIRNQTGLCK